MDFDPVTITVQLDDDVAAQLAQFCKRSTYTMFFELTEAHLSHAERSQRAYMMINGIERIQAALAKAGHAPR
jgi:predicted transcriptional regulator